MVASLGECVGPSAGVCTAEIVRFCVEWTVCVLVMKS